MNAWLTLHALALRDAWRRLIATPLGSLLSLLVIGIALALPAGGWMLIDNLQRAASNAAGAQQISLFLTVDADRKAAEEIESRLKAAPPGQWRFVSREEALKQLQGKGRMGDLAAGLPKNPLPDAFIVEPTDTSPDNMTRLAETFAGWPRVAHVQLDAAWVKRFDAFLRIARLMVALLAGVFAVALVITTLNTIRLQILASAAEIELAQLIGATDGWIRRPFAYFGALQGLFGSLLAALLLILARQFLAPPVAELAGLYGASFTLSGPGWRELLALIGAGTLLGWIGAQISVGVHLRRPA